ncbi:MAG: enoyl-CoA hydratase/isomerase family protein [Neisseriaceae bacterium]|nr:enoyl-CoA hydratase/isomerase family protein [Neisseriaceae bacterium]
MNTDSAAVVLSHVDGNVGVIQINRPDVMNALNEDVMIGIAAAVQAFEADDGIGAMVLCGHAKAFAAGADIGAMRDFDYASVLAQDFTKANWDTLRTARKPIVAAVSGFALGGGCELAMLCDLVYAADTAKFGQPEIKLGTMPGAGGTQRLSRAIGKAKAMDMALTGRMLSAREAEQAGLVARVFPSAYLLSETLALAQAIAEQSRPVSRMIKEAINQAYESPLQAGLLFERRLFHATFALADQKEGMTAFVEKRKPKFSHR